MDERISVQDREGNQSSTPEDARCRKEEDEVVIPSMVPLYYECLQGWVQDP